MISFPLNENWFSFFVADHLLVGQLCTNPKSDRSLLSCLKGTQCSTSEIGDALLCEMYESPCPPCCGLSITGPLPAPSKCKSGLPRITGVCPGWWKESFRLRLWSLVWFQVSIRLVPTGACGKGMLPVPDPYRCGDWGWRGLHWIDVNSTT